MFDANGKRLVKGDLVTVLCRVVDFESDYATDTGTSELVLVEAVEEPGPGRATSLFYQRPSDLEKFEEGMVARPVGGETGLK